MKHEPPDYAEGDAPLDDLTELANEVLHALRASPLAERLSGLDVIVHLRGHGRTGIGATLAYSRVDGVAGLLVIRRNLGETLRWMLRRGRERRSKRRRPDG